MAHTFAASTRIQLRVIHALIMREIITRYGRHNIGFMWLFAEPMLFTLGVTGLWSLAKQGDGHHISVAAFALTGYSTVLLWRNVVNRCTLAITPNLALLYHRNVKLIDIFLARITLEVAGSTGSFIGLAALLWATGLIKTPDNIIEMLLGWVVLIWFSSALGLVIGSLSERSDVVERVWHTVTYLLFPLSGAAYMVDWLPHSFQRIVLLLPMVHATEIIREGYYGTLIRFHYDVLYVAAFNCTLTLVGLLLTRDAGKRVEPQ